jgi:AcrR family transcriptional regulator
MTGAAVLGASDGSKVFEATRRRLSPRQADVVAQLVLAAEEEIEAVSYPGLTVRNVARRAGVAPATAYNYFSSKDHLLAEVLWRRMQGLAPADADPCRPVRQRVADTVRDMVLLTTESPALVDACTVALLGTTPDVKHLRDRIGADIQRRLAAAVGPGVDPMVVRVLETSFSGALLAAGMGHMASRDIPEFVADAAELMIGGGTEGRRTGR